MSGGRLDDPGFEGPLGPLKPVLDGFERATTGPYPLAHRDAVSHSFLDVLKYGTGILPIVQHAERVRAYIRWLRALWQLLLDPMHALGVSDKLRLNSNRFKNGSERSKCTTRVVPGPHSSPRH